MATFGRESGKVVWRGDAIVRQIDQATLRAARRTIAVAKANSQRRIHKVTGRMAAGVETEVSNVAGGRLVMTMSNRVPYAAIEEARHPAMSVVFAEEVRQFPKRLAAEMARIR